MDKEIFWKVALFIFEDISSLQDKSSGGYCTKCYSKEVVFSRLRMVCKDCGSIVDIGAYRQVVLAQMLETEEGREALAQAMVEPIRRSLEYNAAGKKILMIAESPETL